MSRSNPSENTPNPSQRWYEWNGELGNVRYYDKIAKMNVDVKLPFSFVLLDQLACVGGWNEASTSSIYSNEVRDTRQDIMIVKSFKGGLIDEGLYKNIKDHITSKAIGGYFVANCYIAYKQPDDTFALGSIKFKGSALGSWMEFCKSNRKAIYEQAIEITSYDEGKKGKIVFRTPIFRTREMSEATNAVALALDRELQSFLSTYLKRTKREQAETAPMVTHEEPHDDYVAPPNDMIPSIDDIPFSVILPLLAGSSLLTHFAARLLC